MKFEGMCE